MSDTSFRHDSTYDIRNKSIKLLVWEKERHLVLDVVSIESLQHATLLKRVIGSTSSSYVKNRNYDNIV